MESNIEDKIDETVPEVKTVRALTAKEMKKLCKPKFQENPQDYWPTKVFSKYGFTRAQCKCGVFYWRRTEARTTCGDSNCVGQYSFIGKGAGYGLKGKKLTYAGAWKQYAESMSKQRIPSTPIARYPVVARWRNDVDYTAAGIFCWQPYCVTGELDPPANPLVQPQFCVRFNDLDNIGLTGRHYSGFVMLGNHVFNYPDKYTYFSEECVEFHLNWLIDMELDLDEVTLIEDVWSGGGNLGSSVEIFMHGLEVGNMVFIRYKYFPDGALEELDVKIIDVGIGLERVPWLINGSATSYMDIFPQSLEFLQKKLQIDMSAEIWKKLGPYSCLLNIDEVDNIEDTWAHIAKVIGVGVEEVKNGIMPVKDMYIILDHCRTAMMIIQDGSLPSNVGGGSNVRNIIRRVFAILKRNGWWEKVGGIEGFLEIFIHEREDLRELYGQFPEYKSFNDIIRMEYQRWNSTDQLQIQKLERLLKKQKQLTIDDWIVAITSYGIPADQIQQISGQAPPGNLYYEMDYRQQKIAKAEETILYKTAHIPETQNLYYLDHKQQNFSATIQEIFYNVNEQQAKNIVILDQSIFYPTSGGQQHDTGYLTIEGKEYYVKNVEKVGKSVLHILSESLPEDIDFYVGKKITGRLDVERRRVLRNHHTATHIVFAACRQVLGPHIWQNGAKKTVDMAHLDVTHFSSLTKEKEIEIENAANQIILSNKTISKGFMDKSKAEKEYGFRLYQGGIVPGNSLRVVNIQDTDVEACCGTHCDLTSEVGWIKLIKSTRISDGILRLYYVAGDRSIERLNNETKIINSLVGLWKVQQPLIVKTAENIFTKYKAYEKEIETSQKQILKLRFATLASSKSQKVFFNTRDQEAGLYISDGGAFIDQLKKSQQAVLFLGRVKLREEKYVDPKTNEEKVRNVPERFIFGQSGAKDLIDLNSLLAVLKEEEPNASFKKNVMKLKQEKTEYTDIQQFFYFGRVPEVKFLEYVKSQGFEISQF